MGSAAGAEVIPLYFHKPYVLCKLELAAVIKFFKLVLRRVIGFYPHILINRPVREPFRFVKLFSCKLPVKIDRHLGAEMEADIIAAVQSMYYTRNDMLARVVLHISESPFPVEFTFHRLPHGHRSVCIMINFPVIYLNVKHRSAVNHAPVRLLTSALREKGGAVKYDGISAVTLLTFSYPCRKLTQMRVGIIQLFRHLSTEPFLYYMRRLVNIAAAHCNHQIALSGGFYNRVGDILKTVGYNCVLKPFCQIL